MLKQVLIITRKSEITSSLNTKVYYTTIGKVIEVPVYAFTNNSSINDWKEEKINDYKSELISKYPEFFHSVINGEIYPLE